MNFDGHDYFSILDRIIKINWSIWAKTDFDKPSLLSSLFQAGIVKSWFSPDIEWVEMSYSQEISFYCFGFSLNITAPWVYKDSKLTLFCWILKLLFISWSVIIIVYSKFLYIHCILISLLSVEDTNTSYPVSALQSSNRERLANK